MNITAKPSQPMHLLVFGAGAIGAYLGGSLALQGHRVTFIEKSEVAAILKQRGLHLIVKSGEYSVREINVVTSLADALQNDHFDLVLFALKSYDTQAALQAIASHAKSLPPFLCLQNGVENESSLQAVMGFEKVIPASVTSAVSKRAPGDIILEKERGIGIADGNPIAARLVAIFQEAGIQARLYPSAAEMKWSKMLTNLFTNATCAILGLTPGEVLSHPGLFHLEAMQLREALTVMQRQNIGIIDLPGTPVRALAFAMRSLPDLLARPLIRHTAARGRGNKMPSLAIDLSLKHGKSEVDYLNGAIVRYGEKLNVLTPVNRLLNDTLLGIVRGEVQDSDYYRQPEKLLQRLSFPAPG